jgi:hypothetical protein
MTGPTDLLEHAMGLFTEPESGVADVHDRVARRQRNRRLGAGAVVVAIWLAIGAAAVTLSSPTETVPVETPDSTEFDDLGWPRPAAQPAGTYSWDAQNFRYMHNIAPASGGGFGLELMMSVASPAQTGGTPITIDGYDGVYRQPNSVSRRKVEEWIVDVDGTPVSILLVVPGGEKQGATEAKVAETHAIIDSIRVEPQDLEPGFRLVFDLPAGWRGDGRDYVVPPAGLPGGTSSEGSTSPGGTELVHGWPPRSSGPQPAGTYSWDAQERRVAQNTTPGSGVERSSFGLELIMEEAVVSDLVGGPPIVIGGYEGEYQEQRGFRNRIHDWFVDIEDTLVRITLVVPFKATDAKIAESYAIIDSIRVEPQELEPGFKLLFDLPAGWQNEHRNANKYGV